MSFGLALAEPSDISIHPQKIGRGSERRYLVVIAEQSSLLEKPRRPPMPPQHTAIWEVLRAIASSPHDLLPRLFEPFYTTNHDGMGRSICRSMIEAHGGRIWATRCGPRGALIQFTIPAD